MTQRLGQLARSSGGTDMTQYMLSVHSDGAEAYEGYSPEQIEAVYAATGAFNEEIRAEGKWIFAGGLAPIGSSTTVDNTRGQRIVTDGPFSESKEYLGGFWIIEAADLDEALELAQRGSAACQGKVEVRPFDGLA
jgi:hypothetical protein